MENERYPLEKSKVKVKRRSLPTAGNKVAATSLCNEIIQPLDTLSSYVIWLHGPAGMGKTSLSAMFPQSHLFVVGGQAKALAARYINVQHWDQFKQLVDAFKRSSFKTATVDLVEVIYDMCFEKVLNDLNIDYPGKTSTGKDDYGKSWFYIRREFANVISKLMSLEDNQGLVLVSNSIFGERTNEEGATVEDVHPNLAAKPLLFISGVVDVIGFYRLNSMNQRELVIRPTSNIMAKCRIDHRFKYTDGTPIESIPMGSSKDEAYANFVKAFENKLERPSRNVTSRRKK